ncbi:GrpB family protein [Anaerosalibacter sp. Marseille-P3206]|uniref:GrpB family protein n=1 Tax=Anaerosalibacter sp. Marseille-P3206 TaxID=1871005 RepID=UPI0009874FC7|nr:GrpB family protein [Anaerosalibacter sp. Marseille-P3206]
MKKQLSEMTLEELWALFPIILKEHNQDYSKWYELEKEKIIKCIGLKNIKRINHIGSSAVSGLISKPTVDILVEIDRDIDMKQIKNILLDDGWILMHEENEEIVLNKGYTPHGFAEKVYHLHVRYYDDWDELYFRDYLLVNSDIVKEYGEFKLSLLPKYKNNRDGYTEAKTDFIKKYTKKAREEFGDRYNPNIRKS